MFIQLISSAYDIAQNISHLASDKFLIHSHPFYELHYFVRGNVEFNYRGRVFPLRPNGLTLIAPNVPHGLRVLSTAPYERYTLHFVPSLLREETQELLLGLFEPDQTEAGANDNYMPGMDRYGVLALIENLMRLVSLPDKVQVLLAPPLLEGILCCVASARAVPCASQPCALDSISLEQQIFDYIHDHYMESLSLDQLAERFYCSKSYLNNICHKRQGTTMMNYVKKSRLAYASDLIDNGYPATQAAAAAGFGEYSSFFRAYVKNYDHAPSQAALRDNRVSITMDDLTPSLASWTTANRPAIKGETLRSSIWQRCDSCQPVQDDPAYLRDK